MTISIKSLLPLALIGCLAMPAFSQTTATTAPMSSEQMLKQLEGSGALDKAVQRSLDRIKKQEELAKKAEAEKQRLAQLERVKNARKVDLKTEPVYGPDSATITLIEYSDFECPYCKRFFDIPKKVVDDMPGKVNLVWRHYPLPFHEPIGTKEAGASICAYQQGGSTAFWKYAEGIFQNTKANNQGIPAEKGEDPLLKLATTQGLNADQFKSCMANDADLKKQVAADIKDGQGAGISGTPGLIIINKANGKVNFINGALPIQAVKDAIKQISD